MSCPSRSVLAATAMIAVLLASGQAAQKKATKLRILQGSDLPAAAPFAPEQFFESIFGKPTAEQQNAFNRVEISAADERQFGKGMVDAYLTDLRAQHLTVVDRGRDIEYLHDLVNAVRPSMAHKSRYRTIKLYLVDSLRIDARSFPGGTLVFFRGLLDFAESEAALLGVVGHELSHLDHGHQLGPLRRMKYFEQSMTPDSEAVSSEGMFSAIRMMVEGFARPFRPEDESEADRDGASWAFRAGYDSREFAELFLRLHRRDGDQPLERIPFLQTHPFNLDRYRAIQGRYDELRRASPDEELYVGRQNLSRRLSRAKREFAEP